MTATTVTPRPAARRRPRAARPGRRRCRGRRRTARAPSPSTGSHSDTPPGSSEPRTQARRMPSALRADVARRDAALRDDPARRAHGDDPPHQLDERGRDRRGRWRGSPRRRPRRPAYGSCGRRRHRRRARRPADAAAAARAASRDAPSSSAAASSSTPVDASRPRRPCSCSVVIATCEPTTTSPCAPAPALRARIAASSAAVQPGRRRQAGARPDERRADAVDAASGRRPRRRGPRAATTSRSDGVRGVDHDRAAVAQAARGSPRPRRRLRRGCRRS